MLNPYDGEFESGTIASAEVVSDRLIITDKANLKTEIGFSQHPTLRRIPEGDRPKFTIPEDGSYLYWECLDIHLDLEGIKVELDPHLKARKVAALNRHNKEYGKAIALVRQTSCDSTMPNLPNERIEAIEQGSFPTLEEFRILAKAHHLSLDEYLEAIANNLNLSQLNKGDRQRILEIQQRLSKATPAPWYVNYLDDNHFMNLVAVTTVPDDGLHQTVDESIRDTILATTLLQGSLPDGKPFVEVGVNSEANWDEDAEFIAHAREDIPYLLNLIQKLLGSAEDA